MSDSVYTDKGLHDAKVIKLKIHKESQKPD